MKTFEQRLSDELIKVTSLVIFAILLLFSGGLLSINYFNYKTVINKNYNKMDDFIVDLHYNNVEMFTNIENVITNSNEIDDSIKNSILREFYAINSQAKIPGNIIIYDENNNIELSTFPNYQISDHMRLFINYLLNYTDDNISYRSYSLSKDDIYLISVYKLNSENKIIYIQPKEKINEILITNGIQGTLIDNHDRVVSSSNVIFDTSSNNKFKLNDGYFNNDRYSYKLVEKENIELSGYSLIKKNNLTTTLYIGISLLFIFYLFVLLYLKKSISKIANIQLKSFNKLISEIQVVSKEDISHTVKTKSNDEFEMIANEINNMNKKILRLSENNAELKYRGGISELKQLEAQFDPHFLYNTLEAIRYSSNIDPNASSDMIISLTKILRYSIDNNEISVPLSLDIIYIKLYCEIQKFRFGDTFSYSIEIEDNCLDVEIPKLCLQPLIENSIKNIFLHQPTAHINIKIYMRKEFMVMEVEDDGIGMKEDKLEQLRESLADYKQLDNHHGLYNTYRRIQLIYGSYSTIHIESEYKSGTKVLLILDLDKERNLHVQNTNS